MKCPHCEREMEPTIALSIFHPELRDKVDVFPWACRYCRVCSTDPETKETK